MHFSLPYIRHRETWVRKRNLLVLSCLLLDRRRLRKDGGWLSLLNSLSTNIHFPRTTIFTPLEIASGKITYNEFVKIVYTWIICPVSFYLLISGNIFSIYMSLFSMASTILARIIRLFHNRKEKNTLFLLATAVILYIKWFDGNFWSLGVLKHQFYLKISKSDSLMQTGRLHWRCSCMLISNSHHTC